MKVFTTLILVLLLAGCAAGKGDGAGSTTTEEETTLLKEEGNLRRPPHSTLSYGGREVKGMLGSYCWTYGSTGVCADSFWPLIPRKEKTLTVPSGSEMVFRYGGQSPPKTVNAGAYTLNKLEKTGMLRPDHPLKAHGLGVQRIIPAELPSGEFILEMLTKHQQGDAPYYFRVVVSSTSSPSSSTSSTASATASAPASASTSALSGTDGPISPTLMGVIPLMLIVGGGILSALVARQTSWPALFGA